MPGRQKAAPAEPLERLSAKNTFVNAVLSIGLSDEVLNRDVQTIARGLYAGMRRTKEGPAKEDRRSVFVAAYTLGVILAQYLPDGEEDQCPVPSRPASRSKTRRS